MTNEAEARFMGRLIVTDPGICRGKPTFRGARVLVADVLEQVASGLAWETIIEQWNDSITRDAIREAVQLVSQALLTHADEFIVSPVSASGFWIGQRGMKYGSLMPRPTFPAADRRWAAIRSCRLALSQVPP